MKQKSPQEVEQARHFISWVTREDLPPAEEPDYTRPSRPGGHPDFIFEDSSGELYILEITRLLTPELRSLEEFVKKHLATPLEGNLDGTYTLEIPAQNLVGMRLPKRTTQQLKDEIETLIGNPNRMPGPYRLSNDFTLTKVRDDMSKLVPWITIAELPLNLDARSKVGRGLRYELARILSEGDTKFDGYSGHRIVLIDISQCGLDVDFHAGFSKSGPGIVRRWCSKLLKKTSNIDHVCLEPGIRVWKTSMNRVLTGHKYVDKQAGHYPEVWTRPGLSKL